MKKIINVRVIREEKDDYKGAFELLCKICLSVLGAILISLLCYFFYENGRFDKECEIDRYQEEVMERLSNEYDEFAESRLLYTNQAEVDEYYINYLKKVIEEMYLKG